jgi:hypothetical protein
LDFRPGDRRSDIIAITARQACQHKNAVKINAPLPTTNSFVNQSATEQGYLVDWFTPKTKDLPLMSCCDSSQITVRELTARVVAAYLSNNSVSTHDIPTVIKDVAAALGEIEEAEGCCGNCDCDGTDH